MAQFFEGKRGSGKSKYAVEKMQNRLKSGRPVATNLDLFLDKLCPDNPKAHYVRIPDFPRSKDLWDLDTAYPDLDPDNPDTYDDKKFGLVILDELLTSFNSRNWNDPDRIEVVNWIVQSRKYGWDLSLIGQSIDAIDKQIKETVIDELCSFRSSVNLFGGIIWNLFFKALFNKLCPKFHIMTRYDGRKADKKQKIGGDHFRRNDLHDCYKTGQQFKKDVTIVPNENGKKPLEIDNRASYTVLHPHYFGVPEEEKSPQEQLRVMVDNAADKNTLKAAEKKGNTTLILVFAFALVAYFAVNDWTKSIKSSESSLPLPINQLSKVKGKDRDKIKDSITEQSNSDLGKIYITCSVYSKNGDFDYCFVNEELQTIRPTNIGYTVMFVNECHSKLKRGNYILDVYCPPFHIPSEKPEYREDTLTASL